MISKATNYFSLALFLVLLIFSSEIVQLRHRRTLIATIPIGQSPRGIAVNPTNGLVYVANSDSNTISVIFIMSQPPPPIGNPRVPIYDLHK